MAKQTGRTWGGDIMRGEHPNLTGHRGNGQGQRGDRADREMSSQVGQTPLGRSSQPPDFDIAPISQSDLTGSEPNIHPNLENSFGGSSIFDPCLTELAYRWFCPQGGRVLDPFAGGSVRGIVASRLGLHYAGIELSSAQVAANTQQGIRICRSGDPFPCWLNQDTRDALAATEAGCADLIFTCPPYGDLERYSDDPRDISNFPLADFDWAMAEIIGKASRCLADNRFSIWVVSDYRLPSGCYAMFPSKVRFWHREAGLKLYNEAVLLNVAGSLPIRAGKQFQGTRKLGRMHQEILVFLKGDARIATAAMAPIDASGIDDALEAIAAQAD